MKIYTLNGRRQYPNWMAGRMGAGVETQTATEGIESEDVPPVTAETGAEGEGATTPEKVQNTVQQVSEWVQMGMAAAGIIQEFLMGVGVGPSYNPNSGGELRRQLQSEAMGANRWTDIGIALYLSWLRDVGGGTGSNTPYGLRYDPCNSVWTGILGRCADVWEPDGFNPSDFVAWMRYRIPGWRPQNAAIPPTPEQNQTLQTIALQRLGVEGPQRAAEATGYYNRLDYDWQRLVDAYQNAYARAANAPPAPAPTPAPGGAGVPPPNAEQLAILQQLAVALAGFAGPDQQATGTQLYSTLPNSWRALVDAMVAQLLAASPTPPPIPPVTPPRPTTTTAGGGMLLPLLAVGAAVLLLTRK
jgi:hypothetical protein